MIYADPQMSYFLKVLFYLLATSCAFEALHPPEFTYSDFCNICVDGVLLGDWQLKDGEQFGALLQYEENRKMFCVDLKFFPINSNVLYDEKNHPYCVYTLPGLQFVSEINGQRVLVDIPHIMLWSKLERVFEKKSSIDSATPFLSEGEDVEAFELRELVWKKYYSDLWCSKFKATLQCLPLDKKQLKTIYQNAAYFEYSSIYYEIGCAMEYSNFPLDAFLCYKSAALKGHIEAIKKVANCYQYGIGVTQDDTVAEQWQGKLLPPRETKPAYWKCLCCFWS